jgi:hypothetical protein
MKGGIRPDLLSGNIQFRPKRQKGVAMNVYSNVVSIGMDVHYKFSSVTFRDEQAQIIRRERLG